MKAFIYYLIGLLVLLFALSRLGVSISKAPDTDFKIVIAIFSNKKPGKQ